MNLLQRLFGAQHQRTTPEVGFFIEAMLILIAADGAVEEAELEHFIRQVRAHSALREIPQNTLDAYVRDAFAAIRREGLEARIRAIAAGLPRREERLVAFTLAFGIASTDGRIAHAESNVLEQLQSAFALTDAELIAARAVVERSLPVESVLAEVPEELPDAPPEQLYIETLLLMAAADGVLEPRELERFALQLADNPEFHHITPDTASQHLDRALRNLERDGVESRIQAIAAGLRTPTHRQAAFRLALEMCVADGQIEPHERTLLKLLQQHLQLDEGHIRAQLDRVLGAQEAAHGDA